MVYSKQLQSPAVILAALFGMMFCAGLIAQKNCTVCNRPMVERGGQWYCPNCQPDKLSASAINVQVSPLFNIIQSFPSEEQEGFLIRLTSGTETEEDLIAEAEKKSQRQFQQYDKPAASASLSGTESRVAEVAASTENAVGKTESDRCEPEILTEQEKKWKKMQEQVVAILGHALRSAGAIDIQTEQKHINAASWSALVQGQIAGVPLECDSFVLHALGLTFLFGTNALVAFTAANIQELSQELQQGHQIQVVITAQHLPLMTGILIPAPHQAAGQQEGSHLLLGYPAFVRFDQLATAFLNILHALKTQVDKARDYDVYFFRRTKGDAF